MLCAYHHRYNLDYICLRYMNVYVTRQDYRGAYIAVIMKMLDAIDRGESPTIMGSGDEAFDFINVKDCAEANICAMKSKASNQNYNVCTGKKTTLKELADLILKITNSSKPIKYVPKSMKTLVKNRIGNLTKALDEIGFKSKVSIREGLEKLIH